MTGMKKIKIRPLVYNYRTEEVETDPVEATGYTISGVPGVCIARAVDGAQGWKLVHVWTQHTLHHYPFATRSKAVEAIRRVKAAVGLLVDFRKKECAYFRSGSPAVLGPALVQALDQMAHKQMKRVEGTIRDMRSTVKSLRYGEEIT